MNGVAKSFDKPLFEDMSMLLEAGQRLAIIGALMAPARPRCCAR